MKHFIALFLLIQSSFSFAQTVRDTNKLSIAVSGYFLPENGIYANGCVAIGPTIFLKDERVSIQFGLLYDLKDYFIHNSSLAYHTITSKQVAHTFIPLFLNLKYYSSNKISLTFTTGFLLERRPEYYNIEFYINPLIGTGAEYNLSTKFLIKASLTGQLSKGDIFPGMLLDLSYSFNVLTKGGR